MYLIEYVKKDGTSYKCRRWSTLYSDNYSYDLDLDLALDFRYWFRSWAEADAKRLGDRFKFI